MQPADDDLDRALVAAYARHFHAPRSPERPFDELKGYHLTASGFKEHKKKILETIVAMANTYRETSFIFCHHGAAPTDETMDPNELDAALVVYAHPRVACSIIRKDFGTEIIDVIIIPPSELRPHVVRESDGKYVIPIRGAANNTTAARHELDAMYDERLQRMIRIIAPGLTLTAGDPADSFLESLGYGKADVDKPQVVHWVTPIPFGPVRMDRQLVLNDLATQRTMRSLMDAVANSDADFRSWLPEGAKSHFSGEDFYEWDDSTGDITRRSYTVRVWLNGTVIFRAVNHIYDGIGGPALAHPWFVYELGATLAFAAMLYSNALCVAAPASVSIRSALIGADQLPLGILGRVGVAEMFAPRDVGPFEVVPRKAISAEVDALLRDAKALAGEAGRVLRSRYGQRRQS